MPISSYIDEKILFTQLVPLHSQNVALNLPDISFLYTYCSAERIITL